MPVKIMFADDHALVRQGLRRIVEARPDDFAVVAEAGSGAEAVEMAGRFLPDVAVLDVGMKGLNGLEALVQIKKQYPKIAVLMLSMHSDERYVLRAIREGASGYVLKDCVEDDLVGAIAMVAEGGQFFSPDVKQWLDRIAAGADDPSVTPDDRFETLTSRERHIYQLLAEGNANKEIAALLNLSLHTVETHRARIMEKLRLHSAAELVLSAVRRGIVT
ncbi:MAG: response regulator transcription factor [Acidobacteria bacterium]|nr:response regulator transcription factor [Acidobacteriota bacterium]